MTGRSVIFAIVATASLTIGIYGQGGGGAAAPGQAGGRGGGRGGGREAGPPSAGNLIEGAWGSKPLVPDARGWGWMVKSRLSPNVQRPLYNQAKEKLLQDKQVTSVSIGNVQSGAVLRSAKALGLHLVRDAAQHPHIQRGAADDRRMSRAGRWCADDSHAGCSRGQRPESHRSRHTGIIVPTVDDALEARDAARFSRYPPFGRRSSGAGTASGFWANVPGGHRQTINDNFLVLVMLETLESIINADEIANTFGLDVVIQGNSDLTNFSGWNATDARYEALLTSATTRR